MCAQNLKGRNDVMSPFQGLVSRGVRVTQGFALGCVSLPLQGEENGTHVALFDGCRQLWQSSPGGALGCSRGCSECAAGGQT